MELSLFGEKFSSESGIRELMDDLSEALSGGTKQFMLGGGNPAHIPKIGRLWERRMREILHHREAFEAMLMDYGSHRGQGVFLEALAGLLNREYGWDLTPKNITVTNGSQNAFFLLFNMLSGIYRDGKRRRILFPLTPEYIGYADQSLDAENFTACRPDIEEMEDHIFKYHINFSRLRLDDDIAGICVSRPTNPTGNVLTDTEIHRLADMAREREIPLLIDNAYGSPFPNIIFEAIHPVWNENIILVMSLSKLGLPAVRTGIVIAREEVISAISAMNAVVSLSSGSIGQAVTLPFIESGQILQISREIITPFYYNKSKQTVRLLKEAFGKNVDYAIHKSEGAFFLWIWFRNLPISTGQLYERLKNRSVLVIPGCYFFYGLEETWRHRDECIRLNYSQNDEDVERGVEILADEVGNLV